MVGTDGQQRPTEQTVRLSALPSLRPRQKVRNVRGRGKQQERERDRQEKSNGEIQTEEKDLRHTIRPSWKAAYQTTSEVVVYNQAATCMTRLCFLLLLFFRRRLSLRRQYLCGGITDTGRDACVWLPYTAFVAFYSIKQPASIMLVAC